MALAIVMMIVGTMARRVYPVETAYVFWLFLFGASLFMADAAVTLTRVPSANHDADAARDRAANPWRIAFAVAFVLTLLAAARTGSSNVTLTAMLMAVFAAGVYLVRRRFFGNLRDLMKQSTARPGQEIRKALEAKDHEQLAAIIEKRVDAEPDPSRRNALLLSLGAVHVVRGAYDDAVRAFQRIDRVASRDEKKDGDWIDMGYVVDLNVASAYVAKGDFDLAERSLSRVDEERLPEEFRVAYDINKSSLLVGKGEHQEAIRFVDGLVLEKIPAQSRLPFLRDLAEALAASGSDPERAMSVAKQCLEIESGPQSLNVVARVLLARREFEDAATRLDEALRMNADGRVNLRVFAETLYCLGLVRLETGRADEARGFFERATQVRGGGRFARAAEHRLAQPPLAGDPADRPSNA